MSGNPNCVFDCGNPRNLFKLPKEASTSHKWLEFISGICDRHFTEEYLVNLDQFQSGLFSKLRLQIGAISSIKPTDGEATAVNMMARTADDGKFLCDLFKYSSWSVLGLPDTCGFFTVLNRCSHPAIALSHLSD
uniref:THAP-type domain-containing protein n=1 Tax=Gouania willdenowi TaxID=441366 RepID=A0A8C5GM47_GOUWI